MVPAFLRDEMLETYSRDPDAFTISLFKAMIGICFDEGMPVIEWDIPQAALDAWYADERCRVYDRLSVKVLAKVNQ